jgi:hypothetical protein
MNQILPGNKLSEFFYQLLTLRINQSQRINLWLGYLLSRNRDSLEGVKQNGLFYVAN